MDGSSALKYPWSQPSFQPVRCLPSNSEDPTIVEKLKALFLVDRIPSDTQMREIIDKVSPEDLMPVFDRLLAIAQRGKVLEDYEFLDRGYLLSIDGTGYFESSSTSCLSCCIKVKKDGTKSYYHQFLPGVIVHPDQKQVIPISAEPILYQDGATKNDCETNATKRLLKRIRKNHPKLKLTVIQDALHSNNPNVRLLRELNMDFIITVKEKGHAALYQTARARTELDQALVVEFKKG